MSEALEVVERLRDRVAAAGDCLLEGRYQEFAAAASALEPLAREVLVSREAIARHDETRSAFEHTLEAMQRFTHVLAHMSAVSDALRRLGGGTTDSYGSPRPAGGGAGLNEEA